MSTVSVCFSPEHKSAAVAYDREVLDFPTAAVNYALERLYLDPETGPFIYEVPGGLLLAEPLHPDTPERYEAEFARILRSEGTCPNVGDFAHADVPARPGSPRPPETDYTTVAAILDRAKIPYAPGEWDAERFARTGVPPRTMSIDVGSINVREDDRVEYRGQPFDGGYGGFYSEFVFGPDGALIAVWAWE